MKRCEMCLKCWNMFPRGKCAECRAYDEGVRDGVLQGAAVAFGLMGMAEAIRQRGPYILDDEVYKQAYPPGYIG